MKRPENVQILLWSSPSFKVGSVWKPEGQTATPHRTTLFSATKTVLPAWRTSLVTHSLCDFHSLWAPGLWVLRTSGRLTDSDAVQVNGPLFINPDQSGETNQLLSTNSGNSVIKVQGGVHIKDSRNSSDASKSPPVCVCVSVCLPLLSPLLLSVSLLLSHHIWACPLWCVGQRASSFYHPCSAIVEERVVSCKCSHVIQGLWAPA